MPSATINKNFTCTDLTVLFILFVCCLSLCLSKFKRSTIFHEVHSNDIVFNCASVTQLSYLCTRYSKIISNSCDCNFKIRPTSIFFNSNETLLALSIPVFSSPQSPQQIKSVKFFFLLLHFKVTLHYYLNVYKFL